MSRAAVAIWPCFRSIRAVELTVEQANRPLLWVHHWVHHSSDPRPGGSKDSEHHPQKMSRRSTETAKSNVIPLPRSPHDRNHPWRTTTTEERTPHTRGRKRAKHD